MVGQGNTNKARQGKGWVKATKESQIKKNYKPTGLITDLLNHTQRKKNCNLIPLKGKTVNSKD